MWTCSECSSYYDTKIQDVPVKNVIQFKVTPWFELQHYPTIDSDDTEIPFIEGIEGIDRLATQFQIPYLNILITSLLGIGAGLIFLFSIT